MLGLLLAGGVAFLVLLYVFQESLLFFPQRISSDRVAQLRNKENIEELQLQMSDGATVRGWLVKNKPQTPLKLLFYYGGNGEELSWHIETASKFGDRSLVLVNYRGYGTSDGKPGETVLLRDALEVYDAIIGRDDVAKEKSILMGRSLGTGVAVHVAAHRPHAGVILVSPYDSMVNVAKRHYPFVPVGWMLRHRFDSAQLAPALTSPVLMVLAENDVIIPTAHSRELARCWGGQITLLEIPATDHNTIGFQAMYWTSVQAFIKGIQ